MMATTVKITATARDALKLLAEADGLSMTTKLERMIQAEKRRRFMEAVNDAFANLRKNEAGWAEMLAERSVLEGSLGDDLDD